MPYHTLDMNKSFPIMQNNQAYLANLGTVATKSIYIIMYAVCITFLLI
jgi:hypothetical protein